MDINVLVYFPIGMTKYFNKHNLMKRGLFWLRSHSQRLKLMQRARRNTAYWLAHLAFLEHPGHQSRGVALPTLR